MTKKRNKFLDILEILAAIFFIFILAIENVNALEKGVTIPLVADRMTDTGEEGSYIDAQVIVTNGTGHVFVDTNPYSQCRSTRFSKNCSDGCF